MDYMKILGILYIILGLFFVGYPLYSAAAVSLIAGISLIAFGLAVIFDGFSIWSVMAHVSLIKIVLGILAIVFGLLFIYKIDALSFLLSFQFYIISFIMILVGIIGVILGSETLSKVAFALIFILGIALFFVATFTLAQPLFVAILVGICLIMEGISLFATGIVVDG